METTVSFNRVETPSMDDINRIDFTMVKLKLQEPPYEGHGWSVSQAEVAEIEYKRFLGLKRKYPDKDIVPNRDVDIFWHQHILDTEKYAKDCEVIFGFFLHHFPYFGMNGPQDEQNLMDAFEETRQLYADNFGSDYLAKPTKPKRCVAPKCRTQCKPMKCR
ncbi:glycine-rich domain-containing protein-like [Chitinophaga niabensis]|uniref:glycine-rich domain-containing protein n=1 Tax=Chitinophaga niabensis TaxID=536979 RepID=UPI0031BBCC49